jgi:hypothetical protein
MCRWANKLDQYNKLKKDGRNKEEQKFNLRSANNEITNTIMQHWAIKARDAQSTTAGGRDEIYEKNSTKHLDRL